MNIISQLFQPEEEKTTKQINKLETTETNNLTSLITITSSWDCV